MIRSITLTAAEQAIYDQVNWNSTPVDQAKLKRNGELVADLTAELGSRGAIPETRLAYFTEINMDAGKGKRSRQQILQDNTHDGGEDLFHNPTFVKYLKYFINGPDLPTATIAGFCKIVDDHHGTSNKLLTRLTKYVRSHAHDSSLSIAVTAEQYFKLATECNAGRFAAEIRRVAQQASRN